MGHLRENDLLKDLSLYVSVENRVRKDMFPNCRKGLGLGGLVQNVSEFKNQDVSMHWVNKIIGKKMII